MEKLIELSEMDNGNLMISLTEEGRKLLTEEDSFGELSSHDKWDTLMEWWEGNSEYRHTEACVVGGLTDSPMIACHLWLNDDGEWEKNDEFKVWWFPEYETVDEFAKMDIDGHVIFTAAPDNMQGEGRKAPPTNRELYAMIDADGNYLAATCLCEEHLDKKHIIHPPAGVDNNTVYCCGPSYTMRCIWCGATNRPQPKPVKEEVRKRSPAAALTDVIASKCFLQGELDDPNGSVDSIIRYAKFLCKALDEYIDSKS